MYLDRDRYNEKVMRMGIARHRARNKEIGHDFTLGDRTENERINKAVEFNVRLDPTIPKDRSMIVNPKWKHDIKEKWVGAVNDRINSRNHSLMEAVPFPSSKRKLHGILFL
jgi:hypothetical protein